MKLTTLRQAGLLLLYSLTQVLVPPTLAAQPKGSVDCVLEWHDGRQTYTYVFSGVVTSQGKPCANARVQLHLTTSNQADVVQEALVSDNGKYELTVSVTGSPEDSADWKLVAQANEIGAQVVEVEGRTIFSGTEDKVFVQRPIQLIEG